MTLRCHDSSAVRHGAGALRMVVKGIVLAALAASAAGPAQAQYEIVRFSLPGGSGHSAGASYTLDGAVGQFDAGQMTGGEYTLVGGFWVEVVPMAMTLPGTLNLRSLGRWVAAYLQPPAGFDARAIDINSIRLHGNVAGAAAVPVDPSAPTEIGDQNRDRVPDLKVMFDRAAVELTLSDGAAVPVTVTGTVAGQPFSGGTTLKVLRAVITAPKAGSVLHPGTVTTVQWQMPAGVDVPSVALLSSLDNGATWTLEANGIPGSGSYGWTVPVMGSDQARVALVVVESGSVAAYEVGAVLAVSEAFTILAPVGVGEGAPVEFALHGVGPNPGRGSLQVDFSLTGGLPARLEVLDVMGRRVMAREVGGLGPGRHRVELRSGLRAGIYLVRVTQGDQARVMRAAVLE